MLPFLLPRPMKALIVHRSQKIYTERNLLHQYHIFSRWLSNVSHSVVTVGKTGLISKDVQIHVVRCSEILSFGSVFYIVNHVFSSRKLCKIYCGSVKTATGSIQNIRRTSNRLYVRHVKMVANQVYGTQLEVPALFFKHFGGL